MFCIGGMSHRIVSWVNVEVRVLERRDFLWQTTNVDQNRGRKRQSMVARLYVRSMVLNFTPRLARRVARLSKRNEGHSSTLKLARRVASRRNAIKDRSFILRSAKRVGKLSKRNEGHSSTLKLARRVASRRNAIKDRSFILRSAKRVGNMAAPLLKRSKTI